MFEQLVIFGAKYLIAVIALLAAVFWWKQSTFIRLRMLITSIIAMPCAFIISRIASAFFYNTRPFVTEKILPLVEHAADNGFPSDHTLLGASIASIVFCFNRKWGVILFILTLLVGLSRVLAHVHHMLDIIGSVIIAIIGTAFAYSMVLPHVKIKEKKDLQND